MRDRDVPEIASLGLCARHRFDVPVPGREGEQDPRLPVDLLVGQAHHPCLGLVAGVHGDEYDGIVALQGLASDIIPAELQGALLIVPVANPFAFGVGRRRTPEDAQDLNRVFPGDRDGSLSERLAALLSREILLQADAVFTLHGSGANGVLSPWIEFLDVPGAVGRASYEMARSSGFDDLIALDRLPGRLLTAMGDLGVPLIEGEVGGRGTTRRENVRYYRERVYAVARHQGILPSPNGAALDETPRRIWRLNGIEADAGGIFQRAVSLKQEVRAGDVLGAIVDARGDPLADVRAPLDGAIGGYREHVGVLKGDSVFTLWTPASEIKVCGD